MTSSATYDPERGVVLHLHGATEGQTIIIRDDMTISAVENMVAELVEWLS